MLRNRRPQMQSWPPPPYPSPPELLVELRCPLVQTIVSLAVPPQPAHYSPAHWPGPVIYRPGMWMHAAYKRSRRTFAGRPHRYAFRIPPSVAAERTFRTGRSAPHLDSLSPKHPVRNNHARSADFWPPYRVPKVDPSQTPLATQTSLAVGPIRKTSADAIFVTSKWVARRQTPAS